MIYIILLLIFLNFITMYIFSVSARKIHIQRIKNHKYKQQPTAVFKSRPFLRTLKRYLSGLVRYETRLTGYIPSQRIRKFLYSKVFLMKLGKNVNIYGGADISHPWNIKIGDNCYIGANSILDGRNGITIKNNVNFSEGVWIWTAQHDVNSETFANKPDLSDAKVVIGDRCWCGPRTIILPGRQMKEGSVLAAGAVLTKDTESFSINAGIPAKKIGERNKNLSYILSNEYLPFF